MASRKPKTVKAAPAVIEDTRRIYVGPTVNGVALRNTVYSDIPETARALREIVPDFLELFLKIEDYHIAEDQIFGGSGTIFNAFKHAEEYINSRKGG